MAEQTKWKQLCTPWEKRPASGIIWHQLLNMRLGNHPLGRHLASRYYDYGHVILVPLSRGQKTRTEKDRIKMEDFPRMFLIEWMWNVKVHRDSSRSVDGRVYILLSAHRKYYLRKMNWIKRCNFWGNKLVIQLENFLEYLVWWWKKIPFQRTPFVVKHVYLSL